MVNSSSYLPGKEGMQKQGKDSQETIVQIRQGPVPPQGTDTAISLSSSAGTRAGTEVIDGNSKPSMRFLNTALVPHHHPIRRKSAHSER